MPQNNNYNQPQYNQPRGNQPQYNQPQYRQPQYNQPQYRQPQPQPQYNQPQYRQPQPQPQYNQPQYRQPQPQYNQGYANRGYAPSVPLATNFSLAKMFWLGLVTFGIYEIVIMSKMSVNINTVASRYDGKKTMHFCLVFFLFSWLTFGILPLIWYTKFSNRIGAELRRRGINYSFGAKHYWLWGILGAVIICGPFIYIHKLCTAMNLLDGDYNARG